MGQDKKPDKRPYVTPRVLQVQRRIDGDNLALGCKQSTDLDSGAGPLQCVVATTCFNTTGS